MYWYTVDLEDADITHLADLLAVEQFHLARALIEIIAKRHAVPPLLDFSGFGPELDVYWVTSLEHLAERGDVDGLCHINYRWDYMGL